MTALALLLVGYSIFSAISIALTHFSGDQYQGQPLSRCMGIVLLLALSLLQALHFGWLYDAGDGTKGLGGMAYRLALFTVAPSFHLFSRPLLSPREQPAGGALRWLHLLPVLAAPLLPERLAQPAAFLVGAAYLLWLGQRLLALRRERARFRAEITLLGLSFGVAIAVAVMGLLPSLVPAKLFTTLYASAIGLAFLLVQTTLNLRPQLSVEVQEAVQATYVSTTLAKVDCDAVLARLEALMASERLFIDPELSLSGLAARLGLSAHQLSELLNTRLGKGFARYVRELRIAAATTLLCEQASASVLSVSLSVGFTSQSNFYEAFREIEGTTPGQYRKVHGKLAVSRQGS